MEELNLRHRELIRLAFSGLTAVAIAEQVGLTPETVRAVLRTPLAQNEIARLSAQADESLTNVPMKVRLLNELTQAGSDALRINHELLTDPGVDPRVRAGIGRHFMDRVIFGKDDDSREGGYRDILRSLDRIEKKVDGDIIEAHFSNGGSQEPPLRSYSDSNGAAQAAPLQSDNGSS